MKVAINIDAKKALLAGSAQTGIAVIDLSDEQVQQLSDIERAELTLHQSYYDHERRLGDFSIATPGFTAATFAELKTVLSDLASARKNEIERKKQDEQNRINNVAARLQAWLDGSNSYYSQHMTYLDDVNLVKDSHPDLAAKVIALRAQRNAEHEKEQAALQAAEREKAEAEKGQKAEKDAAEAAKEAAKVKFIAAWISEHGTENQKGRAAEGLLNRKEIVDAIAASVFAPLFPAFSVATYPPPACPHDDDYNQQNECEENECEVKHRVDACDSLNADQYTQLVKIRDAASKLSYPTTATAVLLAAFHDCNHDDCHVAYKAAAKVEAAVGPFTLVKYLAI